jgi:hypothetical protein
MARAEVGRVSLTWQELQDAIAEARILQPRAEQQARVTQEVRL